MNRIEFFQQVMKLKDIKRTGWLYKDIPNPESVADHSFGTAVLALIVPLPKGVERDRLVKMALVHDVAEVEIGDIVWETGTHSNKDKQKEKHISEGETINRIFSRINQDDLKESAIEFLEQKTMTAKFLKELDKLEMVLQALEYEKKVHPSSLDEFWQNAKKYIKDENLLLFFNNLSGKRSI